MTARHRAQELMAVGRGNFILKGEAQRHHRHMVFLTVYARIYCLLTIPGVLLGWWLFELEDAIRWGLFPLWLGLTLYFLRWLERRDFQKHYDQHMKEWEDLIGYVKPTTNDETPT